MNTSIAAAALCALLAAGCSGGSSGGGAKVPGGGGGGGGGGPAPTSLAYPTAVEIFLAGVAIDALAPTVDGQVDAWTVKPPLPAGLLLDAATGVVAGVPAGTVGRGVYTVHAANAAGEATFELTLEVVNPPRFAYVTNADDTISRFAIDLDTGAFRYDGYQTTPSDQLGPRDLAVGPDRDHLYVTSHDTHNVSVYAIDPVTGELAPETPAAAGANPWGIALTRDGRHVYVANSGSNDVYAYRVEPSGALAPIGAPVATGAVPTALACDPSNRFLYVVNSGSDTISIFSIQADGTLVEDLAPVATGGTGVHSIAVDPDGEFAYVVTQDDNVLQPFAIDPVTGGLQPLPAPRATGAVPSSVAVHPTGLFTYVTNATDGTISAFGVDDETGDLVELGAVTTGASPAHVEFDPSGTFAYVVNQGSREVGIFTVDGATGALTSAGAVRAREPFSMAVVPGLGPMRQRAKYAYALNRGSRTIDAYRVEAPSGELTQIASTGTGLLPAGIVGTPDGETVLVIHERSGIVVPYRVDPRTGDLRLGIFFELFNTTLRAAAVDPSGNFLFVAGIVDPGGANDHRVIALRLQDGGVAQALSSAPAGTDPTTIAVDPTGQFVIVGSALGQDVRSYRIDPRTGVLTAAGSAAFASGAPTDLAFHPNGHALLATIPSSDRLELFRVDATTGAPSATAAAATLLGGPVAVAMHPLGRYAYVAVAEPVGLGNVTVVDVAEDGVPTVRTEVLEGTNPRTLAFAPSGAHLYVANTGSRDVSVFAVDGDTGDLSAGVAAPAGEDPIDLVVVREVE